MQNARAAANPAPAATTTTNTANNNANTQLTSGTFVVKTSASSYNYTGKAITPGVTVTASGKTVAAGNYNVAYSNNVKVGTATVKVTGTGTYAKWSGQTTFKIIATSTSGGDGKAKVGDYVTFASGKYYANAYGSGGSGNKNVGKKVYITKIASGSPYPYHISTGKKLGSGDLGWVKLSQLKGYAKGTLGVKQNELNWTHEGEIIRPQDGAILRQLNTGTQVIPKSESENLMKWAALDPYKWLESVNVGSGVVNNQYAPTITNHYDSLLTVNGDVTRDALPELQEILKQACDYTNKYNAREARKAGFR